MQQLAGKLDREYAEAVLEVAFRANIQIMKELMGDVRMSEELLEIVKPIIEPQILLREQSALEKGMKSGMEKGIRGAVDILRDFGHRDTEIKTIIMKKYSLADYLDLDAACALEIRDAFIDWLKCNLSNINYYLHQISLVGDEPATTWNLFM